MSQYYFSKLFKMSTGTTPHQYVMRQRVERAQEHLRETRTMLAEIATLVGFETQSHFTSVFRRLVERLRNTIARCTRTRCTSTKHQAQAIQNSATAA